MAFLQQSPKQIGIDMRDGQRPSFWLPTPWPLGGRSKRRPYIVRREPTPWPPPYFAHFVRREGGPVRYPGSCARLDWRLRRLRLGGEQVVLRHQIGQSVLGGRAGRRVGQELAEHLPHHVEYLAHADLDGFCGEAVGVLSEQA